MTDTEQVTLASTLGAENARLVGKLRDEATESNRLRAGWHVAERQLAEEAKNVLILDSALDAANERIATLESEVGRAWQAWKDLYFTAQRRLDNETAAIHDLNQAIRRAEKAEAEVASLRAALKTARTEIEHWAHPRYPVNAQRLESALAAIDAALTEPEEL